MMKNWISRNRIAAATLAILFLLSAASCAAKPNPSEDGDSSRDVSVSDNTGMDTEQKDDSDNLPESDTEEPSPPKTEIDPELDLWQQRLALIDKKLSDANTISSDIVSGIDHSSIRTDGDTTLFQSVMSDGTVVRFSGNQISIVDNGIMLYPGGSVVSLDAVGKIYTCAAKFDTSSWDMWFDIGYGYTYSADKTSVQTAEEVHTWGASSLPTADWQKVEYLDMISFQPNFVFFTADANASDPYVLTSMTIQYNPTEKTTEIESAWLDTDFYSPYMEGDAYNQDSENLADVSSASYDFYLKLKTKSGYAGTDTADLIMFVPSEFYTVGELRDADGNVLDKSSAHVYQGTTLDVTIGDSQVTVELPVVQRFTGAETMHDLTPFCTPAATGIQNVLVVPMVWADQTYMATDEQLAVCKKALGCVMDENGNVTDYSDAGDTVFSLSEYFTQASYGKMSVQSFVTDFYYTDMNFAEYEFTTAAQEHADQILEWVKDTYPEMDWSLFDQDENGYVDSVIILNLGEAGDDAYDVSTYGGAVFWRFGYVDEYAGTPDNPNLHTYVSINQRFLQNGETNTLIHEFSHNLGLIDYYDVTYSGINAVGGFDMQSYNAGDWNCYSKLAVGWMEPQVVSGLASGESVELTIGSSALTDDVIVIPAAGDSYDGPFGEYIMLDLFSDDGVNAFDAVSYGLDGAVGIRISHVNAVMEAHEETGRSSETYRIGTIHCANDYKGDGKGMYNIEVIQSGGVNTFTNLDNSITLLSKDDLFYAGDRFSVETYSEFFYEGRMDSGMEFGYTIEIVRIGTDASGNPSATVRVTAK